MKGTRIAPYPTLAGGVVTAVSQVTLDGSRLGFQLVSSAERVVAVHHVERRDWETARITVQVTVPTREIAEGPWGDVACHAVLTDRSTNLRTVTPLRVDGSGEWLGVVEAHRDRHGRRADLTTVVTATVGGVRGRIIATAEGDWTIDFVAPVPRRQRSVRSVWLDFDSDSNPHMRAFRADPWTVDTTGDEPVLYLNSSFEGLRGLLSGPGGDKSTREAVLSQISMHTWTALFHASLDAVGPGEGDGPSWPGGWQEAVLRKLLPDMFPDRSPGDALREVVERRNGSDSGSLQGSLLHAAVRQSHVPGP